MKSILGDGMVFETCFREDQFSGGFVGSFLYTIIPIFRFSQCHLCHYIQADISADQINSLLEATGNKEVEAFYPIIFANFLSSPEKLAALIAMPAAGGGGGGGGGGAAGGGGGAAGEEEKEEEKEEEVEEEIGGGMAMFGGDDGGDY